MRESLLSSHHSVNAFNVDEAASVSFQELMSPCDLSPELTRHFRGPRMWLPLQLFGLAPFREALKEKALLCRYAHREIKAMQNFQVGPGPELSVHLFRYLPEDRNRVTEANKTLVEEVLRDGRIVLSSVTIRGTFRVRMAVLSFKTHLDTIKKALQVIKEAAERLPNDLK